ncbi:hypothetical protein NUW58_g118 [Xylaria curta]|uniref:Uncharacterized protein n=2 Tax=Xylaria curta TaxID=42375 RepID=A0ACC1P1V5_9PEZI|nr:hypothetical protein NUW58_g5654 [Xylaria curta]KAJ2999074.1 hypothetical protein NUW58_g118 [Xylaria curta]
MNTDDTASPSEKDISTVTSTSPKPSIDGFQADTPDATDDWSTPEPPEPTEFASFQRLQSGIFRAWEKRHTSRYERVIVLIIRWGEHDFDDEVFEKSLHDYETMFTRLYNYDVWRFKIPKKKPRTALANELARLAEKDSPQTLFVIWYDGHGREHEDRRGPPMWCSHGDPKISQSVDSGILSTNLGDCEADILLFNNACESLACDRFNGGGVIESISASAFKTSTYAAIDASDLSPSMTWAVYRILSDEKCVEHGITAAELHRRICLATQWAGSSRYPDYGESDDERVFWCTSDVRTQPVYTRLSADEPGPAGATRSIVLRSLPEGHGHLANDYAPRHIRLELGICNLEDIDPKQWMDWIASAPPSIKSARLEQVHEQKESVWDGGEWF